MRIHAGHPDVAALVQCWRTTESTNHTWRKRKIYELKRTLALGILEPQLRHKEGEPILHYHRFLTMKPSGVHSFAHGSEMVSHSVYWVAIGRIGGDELKRINAHSRMMGCGEEAVRIGSPPKFLVPLRGPRMGLAARYQAGTHEPYFVIPEENGGEVPRPDHFTLDVSALGDHLFRLEPGRYDWYTEIEVVFGTSAVRDWLVEHRSEEVLNAFQLAV